MLIGANCSDVLQRHLLGELRLPTWLQGASDGNYSQRQEEVQQARLGE